MNGRKIAVYIVIGAVLAFFNIALEVKSGTKTEFVMLICNAVTVPGVLLTGFGTVWKLASVGFFDIFGYGLRCVIGYSDGIETYGEYVQRKNRRADGANELLLVGGIFLMSAVACIFAL